MPIARKTTRKQTTNTVLSNQITALAVEVQKTQRLVYGNGQSVPGVIEKINALTTLVETHAALPIHSIETYVAIDGMGKFIARVEKENIAAVKAANDRKSQIIAGIIQGLLGTVKWGGVGIIAAAASYVGTHWPWP